MAQKKSNTLVKNTAVLMAASMISRVIGLIYRRPLARIVGTVGLGYYGIASNLYSILLLISSYSIPMAVSKIVSERLALKQYRNAHKVFRAALIYAAIVGGAAALLAGFGGRLLLPANQQNAFPALRVLAPTIFLSAILGVFRGYFQAHKSMAPTSISQIAEQILNAIVSVLAAYLLVKNFGMTDDTQHAIYGAMGGTMGTAAGVIIALLFMLMVFLLNKGYFSQELERDHTGVGADESYQEIFRVLILMVTPVVLTTFINNASTYFDSYIYSTIQGWHGILADAISSNYGEYSTFYIPICTVPLAMASASGAAMMPEVSGLFARRDLKQANDEIRQTIRLTMFLVVPAVVGLIILAGPVMGVMFPTSTELSARLLKIGAVYIFFATLSNINGSVLQSIGHQRRAMVNSAAALLLNLVSLAVLLFLVPRLDVYAIMIANLIYWVTYCFLNQAVIRRLLGFRNELLKTYLYPGLASAGMAAVALGVYWGLFFLTRRPSIALLVSILLAIVVYLVLYVIVSGTKEEEMRRFPMGTKIVRFMRLIRVYR